MQPKPRSARSQRPSGGSTRPRPSRTGKRPRCVVAQFEADQRAPIDVDAVTLRSGVVDYYELLQVPPGAKPAEIKASYRQLQKLCHPDILGPEHGHDASILLNQAYTVLSNEHTRELYDIDLQGSKLEEQLGFRDESISEWVPTTSPDEAKNLNPEESRALFVDERTCIGCKSCIWQAKKALVMDEEHGRARVVRQWADNEDALQAAVDVCPVDCIHWVDRGELPVLEHVMKRMGRLNVGIMQSYNHNALDVFEAAAAFRAKKAQSCVARKSWTEAYMYTKAQEDAMARARGVNVDDGEPRWGPLGRLMAWIRSGFWVSAQEEPIAWQPPSAEAKGPVGNLRDGTESEAEQQ